jgi:SAM-dependent MidA family methyltransferase
MHAITRPLAGLPEPEAAALAASAALTQRIDSAIDAAGGALDFARFMELALYAPQLGYYSGGARKFGASGDFTTAPEISPLFGRTLARTLAPVLAATRGELIELGAGTGRLACDLLDALAELGALPARYAILELSGELRARQQALLAERHPALASRVHWLDQLPGQVRGVIVANEVLDVVPVHLVCWGGGEPQERCVARASTDPRDAAGASPHWRWLERPIASADLAQAVARLPLSAADAPYMSEVAPAAAALAGTLISRLERGLALFIDYGFGRAEYYHPQRRQGTLMCHYRQHAHTDPFFLPGLQDITAHVDFTAVAEAALAAGGRLAGYTTQASYLLDAGLADLLARTPADQPARYLPQAAAVQRLVSPAEMGELFKVMAISRDLDPQRALPGLGGRDLSRLL